MALTFQTVHVPFNGVAGDPNNKFSGKAEFERNVRTANAAIKGFFIGYSPVGSSIDDHEFLFQRVSIEDVSHNQNTVNFNIRMMLNDDSGDPNRYTGEIAVLIIADLE